MSYKYKCQLIVCTISKTRGNNSYKCQLTNKCQNKNISNVNIVRKERDACFLD